jgi:hypothetical protein
MRLSIRLLLSAAIICALFFSAQPVARESNQPVVLPELPFEPYPYATLPITSAFGEGSLKPFSLLAAFGSSGFGQVSFEDSCVKYESGSWSWLAVRTNELQNVVNAKWVWKPVAGREFIIEAWNARTDRIGNTAMITFRDGKVYQTRYPNEVCLMDFDAYKAGWVVVRMVIDYNVPEIRELWINGHYFSHLLIGDEPIGATNGFWQMQIFLAKTSTVLVQEMQAWK